MKIFSNRYQIVCIAIAFAVASGLSTLTMAQENADELAKQVANPVASLISVPIQLNYDQNIGADDEGERWVLNIQPVTF